MKFLITGATGLIGKHLTRFLMDAGHEVHILARRPERARGIVPATAVWLWSDSKLVAKETFRGVDAVVHLAGENIADKRWSPARKARLVDSRCEGTRNLLASLASLPPGGRPRVFVAASAIGYYGETGEATVDESSPPGAGFLADLCVQWERISTTAEALGLRWVVMRIGLVLSAQGGALARMPPLMLGDGQQWMSTVHIDDLVRFVKYAAEKPDLRGTYNLTSPQPVRNRDFAALLARHRGWRLATARVPGFLLRLGLGEMAVAVVASQKVLPTRTLGSGFRFHYPDVQSAFSSFASE